MPSRFGTSHSPPSVVGPRAETCVPAPARGSVVRVPVGEPEPQGLKVREEGPKCEIHCRHWTLQASCLGPPAVSMQHQSFQLRTLYESAFCFTEIETSFFGQRETERNKRASCLTATLRSVDDCRNGSGDDLVRLVRRRPGIYFPRLRDSVVRHCLSA
jgi:hypothetical protein